MKHDKATEEIQELAALYALGSLSQHEARAFELHLREGCSVCEAELRLFEQVAAGIGLGAPEVEPSDYLRDLLAARIEREARAEAPSACAPKKEVKDDINARKADIPPVPVRQAAPQPLFAPPLLEQKSYLPWALAAALAVTAAISFYAWRQAEDANVGLQQKVASAQGDADTLRSLLEIQTRKASELEQITSILGSPGARVILLTGQEQSPSASAAVFWDTQKRRWLIIGTLPPPPAGKGYQLWFITSTAKISAGLLKTDPLGRTFTTVDVPRDVTKVEAATITLEPEGGSQQPTMPIYALGKVG